MTGTLKDLCDELMTGEHPVERLEPEGFAAEFAAFFRLSARPALAELAELFERAGIGKVSPARLPRDLRGVHYTLPNGSCAIHYQEGQWEASSEFTVLHEGYEICHETLWRRCHGQASGLRVCAQADRFAAAALMPPETFAAYAQASGLDVVALKNVFNCAYSTVTIRLTETMGRQPLLVVLYEREEQGDPADWPAPTRLNDLRVTVTKRTAGFGAPRSRLISGKRGGVPYRGRALPAGSLAEQAARSGRREYAEGDGLALVAAPVLWKDRLAKLVVVAVPWEHRRALAPQLCRRGCRYPENNSGGPCWTRDSEATMTVDP